MHTLVLENADVRIVRRLRNVATYLNQSIEQRHRDVIAGILNGTSASAADGHSLSLELEKDRMWDKVMAEARRY